MDRSLGGSGRRRFRDAVVRRRTEEAVRRVERATTESGQVKSSQLNAPIPANLTGVVDAGSVTTTINDVSVSPTVAGQITDITAALTALAALVGSGGGGGGPEYLYAPDGTDPDWLTDVDGHVLRWSA